MAGRNRFNDQFQNLRDRERALRDQARRLRDERGVVLAEQTERQLQQDTTVPESVVELLTSFEIPTTNTNLYQQITQNWDNTAYLAATAYTTRMTAATTGNTYTFTYRDTFNPDTFIIDEATDYNRRQTVERLAEQRRREQHNLSELNKKYKQWSLKNKVVKAKELNTNYGYFKHQNNRNLEVLMLEAIINHTPLTTKTTKIVPSESRVYLCGKPILKYNSINFKAEEIYFPLVDNLHEISLFRHRLRQLGIRCLLKRGYTRIYFNNKEYATISPGDTCVIDKYDIYCISDLWKSRINIELPSLQFNLFDKNEKILPLKQFDYEKDGYTCSFELELSEESNLIIRAKAKRHDVNPTDPFYILNTVYAFTYNEWKFTGPKAIIDTVKNKLNFEIHKATKLRGYQDDTYTNFYNLTYR